MTRVRLEHTRWNRAVRSAARRVAWVLAVSFAGAGIATWTPAPATAFWPFTREAPVIADSMLAQPKMAERFGSWKTGGPATVAAPKPVPGAASNAAPSPPTPGATAPPGTPPPARVDSLPPSASELASGLARGDSLAAASAAFDSTALAGSTPPGAPGATDELPAGMPPAAVAAVLEKGFAPDFTSKLTTSNDYVKLSNDFAVTFSDPTGITLGSVLSYAQDQSLTQHTELHTKTMTNNLNMPLRRLGVNFGISTFNRKTDQTARTISNASTSNQTDDKGADASLGVGRRLDRIPGVRNLGRVVRGFSVNGFVAHRANQAFQDIVATQGTGAGQRTHTGSGNSYGGGGGYTHKYMSLRARMGTTEIDNVDKSKTLPNGQTESTSEGDTTSVDVTVPAFWRAANIVFGYRAVRGNDSYTDQVRSSSGGQTGTIGNFALETKHTQNRALNFGLRLKPWSRADMGFTINAGRDSTTYDLRQNAFVDNKRVAWKFDSKWNLWLGTNVTFNYESSATDVNQDEGGKPNANTRRDEERKLYVELLKGFTKTMSIRFFADTQLNQGMYDHEGPSGLQDRDDLRWRFGGDFNGAIGTTVTANVTAYLREYDQAFIDARSSANSRNETEYVIRNGYTWRITPHVTIGQNFGLSSKVLEVVFKPEQNTLNRNHFMNTHLDCQITPRLTINTGFDYLLQDNGGYVRIPGNPEPLFAPTTRTKKDGIGVGIRYDIIEGGKLTFTSRQDATRERSTRFNGRPASILERGNLALGFESKLQVKDLKLDCRAQRNQSFNIAINRDVYYNVDATLQYTF